MKVLVVALEAPTGALNGLRLPLAELLARLPASVEARLVAYRLPGQPEVTAPPSTLVPRGEGTRAARVVEVIAALRRREPLSVRSFADGLRSAVARQVDTWDPDVVHVFGGPLSGVAGAAGPRPSILTAMDAASLNVAARAEVASGLRRAFLRDEERRVVRFQRRTYPLFRRVVMVTEQDAAVLSRLVPGVRTAVITNGVAIPPDDGRRERVADGPAVLFHGALSYAPNVLTVRHLVTRVWPLVRRRQPSARLALIGRTPAAEVVELARAEGVSLVGEVPDVWPWLRGADVYACPMASGTGIKNKLLEAMGAGLACVASPLAVQGLTALDGTDLLVETAAEDQAAAICGLLEDAGRRSALGTAAARYVADHHSWDAYAAAYAELYDHVVREATATG